MADAWGGSFGISWGSSWGDGVTPPVVEDVRQPGGWLPIIYVDKQGRPIDLDKVEEKAVNQAVQSARKEVKKLKGEDKADAKEALRDLQRATDRDEMIAAARELSAYVSEMDRLIATLEQIEEAERDVDAAAAILLMA